jgi:hypothetical protein
MYEHITIYGTYFFLFYRCHMKCFFVKNLYRDIEYPDLYVKFIFEFFNISKFIFYTFFYNRFI